jgi:hypothetical protein
VPGLGLTEDKYYLQNKSEKCHDSFGDDDDDDMMDN